MFLVGTVESGDQLSRRSIDPSDLTVIEDEMRFILAASLSAGKLRVS